MASRVNKNMNHFRYENNLNLKLRGDLAGGIRTLCFRVLNKNVGEMMIRQTISSIATPALNSAGLSAINGVSLFFRHIKRCYRQRFADLNSTNPVHTFAMAYHRYHRCEKEILKINQSPKMLYFASSSAKHEFVCFF